MSFIVFHDYLWLFRLKINRTILFYIFHVNTCTESCTKIDLVIQFKGQGTVSHSKLDIPSNGRVKILEVLVKLFFSCYLKLIKSEAGLRELLYNQHLKCKCIAFFKSLEAG